MSLKTIESMIDWVEDNIMDNPTLDGLSSHVGYSSYYCSAKFHESYGITLKQYISRRRLSLAAIEVKDTGDRLLEVALKYGYSSQEAFTRAFVDTFGCTPYQCRKESILPQLYLKPESTKRLMNYIPINNEKRD